MPAVLEDADHLAAEEGPAPIRPVPDERRVDVEHRGRQLHVLEARRLDHLSCGHLRELHRQYRRVAILVPAQAFEQLLHQLQSQAFDLLPQVLRPSKDEHGAAAMQRRAHEAPASLLQALALGGDGEGLVEADGVAAGRGRAGALEPQDPAASRGLRGQDVLHRGALSYGRRVHGVTRYGENAANRAAVARLHLQPQPLALVQHSRGQRANGTSRAALCGAAAGPSAEGLHEGVDGRPDHRRVREERPLELLRALLRALQQLPCLSARRVDCVATQPADNPQLLDASAAGP
mmetsp:Transcript_104973/g.303744  ORF Transcript_104973/g.303744 Transcript_104973/m.303744 type:complete len:291 (-) Transcript_104973:168-1040(-)